jgi:hypothetical protein
MVKLILTNHFLVDKHATFSLLGFLALLALLDLLLFFLLFHLLLCGFLLFSSYLAQNPDIIFLKSWEQLFEFSYGLYYSRLQIFIQPQCLLMDSLLLVVIIGLTQFFLHFELGLGVWQAHGLFLRLNIWLSLGMGVMGLRL